MGFICFSWAILLNHRHHNSLCYNYSSFSSSCPRRSSPGVYYFYHVTWERVQSSARHTQKERSHCVHGNRNVCRRNWATSGLFLRPLDVPGMYCDPTVQLPQTPIPFPSFQWLFSVCVCVSQHLFSSVTCLRKKKYLVWEPSLVFEYCYCFLCTINLLVIFIIIRVDLIQHIH